MAGRSRVGDAWWLGSRSKGPRSTPRRCRACREGPTGWAQRRRRARGRRCPVARSHLRGGVGRPSPGPPKATSPRGRRWSCRHGTRIPIQLRSADGTRRRQRPRSCGAGSPAPRTSSRSPRGRLPSPPNQLGVVAITVCHCCCVTSNAPEEERTRDGDFVADFLNFPVRLGLGRAHQESAGRHKREDHPRAWFGPHILRRRAVRTRRPSPPATS